MSLCLVAACGAEFGDELDEEAECAACAPDSGPADSPDDPGTPAAEENEVCFPGNGTELCLPLVEFDPLPEELVYPAEGPSDDYFAGNPQVPRENYRPPIAFIDLEAAYAQHGEDVMLYPNFRLNGIGQSRVGQWAVIQPHAYAHLQALRDAFGPTSVISGYRSPGYNSVGGGSGRASNSRHMWGDAFDFDPPVSLAAAKTKCEELGAYFTNLYTTHIHCDWRQEPVDERFFGSVGDRRARPDLHGGPVAAYDARIVKQSSELRVEHEGFDEGVPLIEWHALDADGQRIGTGSGARYVPTPGAASVEVTVAGWLERQIEL